MGAGHERAVRQPGGHPGGGVEVGYRVGPGAAEVAFAPAGRADEPVVIRRAAEVVLVAVAPEHVLTGGAGDPFDPDEVWCQTNSNSSQLGQNV